jgi:hypothetical protein
MRRFPCSLFSPACLLGVLLLTSLTAAARDLVIDPYHEYRDEVGRGEFSYDDSQDIPWIENEAEVLAVPKADELVRVDMDQMPPGLELWVDTSRITVDPKDRVIRLWLWVRSKQGAENGTFEGYRCETGEYKVYAYANPHRDPPVSKAKRPTWRTVSQRRNGNYRLELLGDYFCGIRGTRTADEIREYMTGEFRRETFMSN